MSTSTRVLLGVAALAVAASLIVFAGDQRVDQRLSHDRDTVRVLDLAGMLGTHAASLPAAGPYRAPTPAERDSFLDGFASLTANDVAGATERLRPLGFTVRSGVDQVTGRRFGLATNEPRSYRSWGHYFVDLSAPTALAVQVPHPANDLHTERIGLELFRAVPGVLLAVSGTNRWAGGGAGDVAHRADSLFHAVAADVAERGIPQLQLHGFHDTTLPAADVVISPGPGAVNDTVRRVADHLAEAGFVVCSSWVSDCGRLEGTRNEQGIDAAGRRTVFVHVEISRTVRDDPAMRAVLAAALATADLTGR